MNFRSLFILISVSLLASLTAEQRPKSIETIELSNTNQAEHGFQVEITPLYAPFRQVAVSVDKERWKNRTSVSAILKEADTSLVRVVTRDSTRKNGDGIVTLHAHPRAIDRIEVMVICDVDKFTRKIYRLPLKNWNSKEASTSAHRA